LTVTGGTVTSAAITTTGANDAAGGNVSITSLSNDITLSTITANGGAATAGNPGQNAGSVTLNSADDITVAAISAAGSAAFAASAGDGGDGGAISITASGETTMSGHLTATGAVGDGAGAAGDGAAILLDTDILFIEDADLIFDTRASAGGTDGSMTLNGNLDGTTGGNLETWLVEAGAATVTLNGNIGSVVAMGDIDVNTTGTLNLGGNVTVTGAGSVLFDGATATVLDTDVTIVASDDNELVTFNTIDGAKTLTIAAGDADVDFNAAIGATTPLTGLVVSSCDTIDVNAAVTVAGDVYIRSTDDSPLAVDVDSTITSTAGSITLYALLSGTNAATIDLNGDITATQNVTLDGNVTLSGTADAITATNGTITTNGNITGAATDLVLTSTAATVSGPSNAPTTATWTLDSLTSTAVGLMTLASTLNVDVDGSGAAIAMGALDGAHALTLTSSAADGDITLNAADIASLTIDDGDEAARLHW
jgi:hypothetical protein